MPRRRKQAVVILMLMLVSALLEVVSLGAVLPFLAVLTAPDKIFTYPMVQQLSDLIGVETAAQLVLPLAAAFALAALVSGAVRLLVLWANNRLAFAVGADISGEIFLRTLYQPYHIHLGRNSSVVLSGITQKAGAASAVLLALLTLVSSLAMFVAIMATLIAIDLNVALLAGLCFGGAYVLIAYVTRWRLVRNGQLVAREQTNIIKVVQEGLGGIRDVLLDGTQSVYCEQYRRANTTLRYAQGENMFMAGAPRLAMEALGMALIAGLALFISRQPGGVSAALPVLGALALGAQRLLPTFQQTYGAWATIAGNQVPVIEAMELLDQPVPSEAKTSAPSPLNFLKEIRFESTRFRYAKEGPWVLDGLDLTISKGARLGIIGGTGSGKSTALDILLGLLEPTEGEVLVDGLPMRGARLRAWQRSIAHVPQSIYLTDASIAENIAFGVPREKIDMDYMHRAAGEAQLAKFIEELPDAYDTRVGERGVRLSGGQRQRLGIARAIYKKASVLVLDEATSALDNLTEQAVMGAIAGINRDTTILIIAHRLTTVRGCDQIVELRDGRAIAYASYEEMMRNHPGALSLTVPPSQAETRA